MNTNAALLSHKRADEAPFDLMPHKARITKNPAPEIALDTQLAWLEELSQFPLGRFLLENKGLNGEMTDYIIHQAMAVNRDTLPPLEAWLIYEAPVVVATRARADIFKMHLQKYVADDTSFLSIPCGLMRDLLALDYTGRQGVDLMGVDLDKDSLAKAQTLETKLRATTHGALLKGVKTYYEEKNAWHLKGEALFDVITSNGLNIYVDNEADVVTLYRGFHKALKPGGVLVTSFLTPPPPTEGSPWDMQHLDGDSLLKQKVLMQTVIQAKWSHFYTEAQVRDQLTAVGFVVDAIIYDAGRMFPTVIARKGT